MGCLEFLCLDVRSPSEGALAGSGSSAAWFASVPLPVCSHIFSGNLLTAFLLLEDKKKKTSQVGLSGWSQPYSGNPTCYCLLSAVASALRGFLASPEKQGWRHLCHPDYRLVCPKQRSFILASTWGLPSCWQLLVAPTQARAGGG